ncbi:helix-turn-helix domain-containing protein [Cytobacillus massiliigabonensis]|uniref:helix-turn-helix domain-containing protein n=1 Tax=Cytobacillus massiliigabonensis TaxID=1871011 RepID=UPI001159201A|nr:helix-turn-helix domain-containing protein [Cytobacillus massiliigabonensis]
MLENIIGVKEASKLWNLEASYIKNLCAQGKVKAKKIGNVWVIDKTQENPKQRQ